MNTSNQTYKELAIPYFNEVFEDIDQIMMAHQLPYYLIGVSALALELLKKGIKPNRGTKDIDFAIMISTMNQYEEISLALTSKGYKKVKAPWTFYSEKYNVAIDILPFGEIEENDTIQFNERYTDLHVLGFKEVLEESEAVHIEEKIALIPPLSGMVILKLVAWNDRPEERENDLSDILRIIQHFYDLEFEDIADHHYDLLITNDLDELLIAAEVLGRKCQLYLKKSKTLSERITGILKNELEINDQSEIARYWARKLDKDINYASTILRAFQKGILSKIA